RHLERAEILLEPFFAACARNGHDVLPLRQYPAERQLRRGAAFLASELPHLVGEREVASEVLTLEARIRTAVVIRCEVVGVSDGTGEETTTERAVGHKADVEPPAGVQHADLGGGRPHRVTAPQRGDG